MARRATQLQSQHHSQEQEEAIIQQTIQHAVVQAVANHIEEKQDRLKPKITPSHGKRYVMEQAQKASEDAMMAARAAGKSYSEVRQAATQAAKRAAEIATRQTAQAAAKSAALRAAQMAANAGKGAFEQQVAAQVAAKAAVRQVIRNDSALRYLNKRRMQVIPGTSSSHWDAGRIAAVNAQQNADVAKAGSEGFPSEPDGDPMGDKTPSVLVGSKAQIAPVAPVTVGANSPVLVGALAADANTNAAGAVPSGADPIAAASGPITDPDLKKEAASAIQAIANLNQTKSTKYPAQSPLTKALEINAAMIRASAAAKRAKAAAIAAKQAPDTPAGHKIVEQARLIGAEAARDVADARMKVELARTGESPKPIIHEAASQAVQIATPIATEVATQSAALQATIQAVAVTKRLMREKNQASAEASDAADKVVSAAEGELQAAVKSRIAGSVKDAVDKAVKGLQGGAISHEAVIAAAKTAAEAQARELEDAIRRHQVKDVSDKAGADAAAAAKAAGADPPQVESIRVQAVNTIRLDGEDAVHEGLDQAETDALKSASEQAKGFVEKQEAAKGEAKDAAKAAVAAAVERQAAGTGTGKSSLSEAEEAISAEQEIKQKGVAAASGSAAGQAAIFSEEGTEEVAQQDLAEPTGQEDSFLQELMGWI